MDSEPSEAEIETTLQPKQKRSGTPSPKPLHTNQTIAEKHRFDPNAFLRLKRSTATADPGPPPDGALQAWMQVFVSHLVLFNAWGYINFFGFFQAYYLWDGVGVDAEDVDGRETLVSSTLLRQSVSRERKSSGGR